MESFVNDYDGVPLYQGTEVWEFMNEFYRVNDDVALNELLVNILKNSFKCQNGLSKFVDEIIDGVDFNHENAKLSSIPEILGVEKGIIGDRGDFVDYI